MSRLRLLLALSVAALLLLAPSAKAAFGLLPGAAGFSSSASEENGSPATLAGSHPFALSTTVGFNTEPPGYSEGDLRDLRIDLPPGMLVNPAVVDRCQIADFNTPRNSPFQESASGESCSNRSQVGIVTVRGAFAGGERSFGVFNLAPPPGTAALLGANPFGTPITLAASVREGGGSFGLTLSAKNVSQQLDLAGFELTLWGNPWLVGHDRQRGDCLNEADPANGYGTEGSLEPEVQPPPPAKPIPFVPGTCSAGHPKSFPPYAYLTLPSACTGPLATTVAVSSWQGAGPITRSAPGHPLAGCDPRVLVTKGSARPGSERASSSSGLDFSLEIPQGNLISNVNEKGRLLPGIQAPSQVKKAVVTLPEGMTVNPSLAAGLGVCSEAQFAAETVSSPPGAGCPNVSKIGEVTVRTPLFEEPSPGGEVGKLNEAAEGSLFLATPRQNPFDSLIALYLVAKIPERGVIVKLAGKVEADSSSGRLVASFDDLPQLPYHQLKVHFREGQRAPLATPAACGTYRTQVDLHPWLDPARVFPQPSAFTLNRGVGGGPCPSGLAPFDPKASGGTANRGAGSYSPFYLRLSRSDAEQEITSYSATLPPGLLGRIAGVPFCPESAIEAAKRNSGFAETERPSCPEASKVGRTTAGYGLGNVLAYAPGNLYLAGPYRGSPLSVVAVDSATVGPFDLGVIIVRQAIRVNPLTAQVSIDSAGSDPIPHILEGIPLHLRDIRIHIDRPAFMVNPTSCDRFSLTSALNGSGPSFASSADDSLAHPSAPFQTAFCSSLPFKPKMQLRLRGGTKRGKYPSLSATVTARPGDANIAKAIVTLPPSEFLAQEHIETICTRPQAAAERCPQGSIYGSAKAVTPLMEEPLEGPVYLRASDNKLPDLVAALKGRGIRIDVVGRIDSRNGGMRATYDVLPDAPLTRFTLTLKGGRHGLLVNSDDACTAKPAKVRMAGHNNATVVLAPKLQAKGCKKGKAKKQKQAKAKKHKAKAKKGAKR